MPLSPGDKLGPYEIVAPLGAGGMGEVYRARDPRLGREVALKILPAEVANDASRRARFELEARAVAALNHPNIVAIYDVGEGYIVSELVDGEPLRAGKLSVRKTIEIAAQVAGGLAAAHDAGIVHRDLKPDNILLTRDGRPKILDFGLAKVQASHADDATVTVRTEAGVVMGTAGYMSPEQVRGAATDHRSDIFSFGVILYELLGGKRAFHGETSVDTMQAILRQEVPELPAAVPAAVRQTVAHCLEKNPAERFQSAHDLRFALSSISQSGSQNALTVTPVARRAWPLRALAFAAIVATTAAATHWLWREPVPPQWSGILLGGPEMALDPRLSPDGHLLALQAFDNGLTQVAVMKPESGNWSLLTHRRDRGSVEHVSWSPDGSLIYYGRISDVPMGVYSVPVLGGEEHLVLENADAPEALPDGSLLVSRVNANRQWQLSRFWPESGRIQEFPLGFTASEFFTASCSRAAPLAKEVITFAAPIGRAGQGLGFYAIDLATNALRRLSLPEQDAGAVQGWTVSRDGKSVFAALIVASITRLIVIPTSGQASPKPMFTATHPVWFLDSAPDQGLYVSLVDRPLEVMRQAPGSGAPPGKIAAFPLSPGLDQVILLPDGRAVTPANVAGRYRLMAASQGKEAVPLVNTTEDTAAPMTLAGPREIAFAIGPAPHQNIAWADTASGRITRRLSPGKGVVNAITASPDGGTLYFSADASVWSVSSTGGVPRQVSSGECVAMEPSGRGLIVTRAESTQTRVFHVPLDGSPEREIQIEPAIPLFSNGGGTFSSGSIDAAGRMLLSLNPRDSWFNPLGILDTTSGRITRVPGDDLSDLHSAVWTPDGKILYTQIGLRANIWKFQPEVK